jgi:hypothetical protein
MAMAVKVLSFRMSRLTLGWLVIRVPSNTTAVVFRVEDRGSCFLRMQLAVTGYGINLGRKSQFILRHKQLVLHWYTDVTLCGRPLARVVGSNPAGTCLSLVSVMYCHVR